MTQALYAHMNNKTTKKISHPQNKKKRTFVNATMYPHPAQQ
jgi:hypothetical protein